MDSQVAAKGIIINGQGQVLLMYSARKGWWEAPGGRLEAGEMLHDGLLREIREETGLTNIEVGDMLHVDEWTPTIEGKKTHIVGIFFACTTPDTQVTVSEEHDDFAWVAIADLSNYPLANGPLKAIERLQR